MSWLVTGGAGYIGGHVVRALQDAGEEVVVVDDLSTGEEHRTGSAPLVVGSVLDRDLVRATMKEHSVHGVVHIAAKKQVGESVERPLHYYEENVEGLRRLLEVVVETGVENLLFSSSAAVYGMPDVDLVTESTPCLPESPYGETKLVGERMISAVAAATGLRYANLRYFNVAGAGTPELADTACANLVPMVFERLQQGLPPRIFGDDYPTPDGTCVRDYIHVSDIASAHALAAQRLATRDLSALTFNVGTGQGASVREMVDLIRATTGTADDPRFEPEVTPRRPGDPARVVASADAIAEVLGWRAQHSLQEMVESAWEGWQARAQQ
ncbi:MAG TPA: UDP-glucose 4-epimerase GalE [Mycobacteriales bacterium]|nr:UDP-glucose 4-epimerase GalE [Mycobacteriales bacterium]